MTLIMALACSDGLILASDSQSTIGTAGQEVKARVHKLVVPWNNLAFGGSGTGGIIQEATRALEQGHNHRSSFAANGKEAQKKIAATVAATLRPLFQNQMIQIPGVPFPHTSLLFAGYCADGPVIFELHPNLMTTDHMPNFGYAAIGSGEIFPYFALASLAHFEVRKRSLAEAKLIAYRIIDDAIRVAAHGLGPPIEMVEIVKPVKAGEAGKARLLDEPEVQAIGEQVVAWKELERETLTKLMMPGPQPPEQPPEKPLEPAKAG